jgi:hypothetical protein
MQSSATYKASDYSSHGLRELQFEMLETNRRDENKYNFCHKKERLLCQWTKYVMFDLAEFLSHSKLVLIYDFINIMQLSA